MHVSAQIEDFSTKDDTGDFAENEITGLSWDATATAYVAPKAELTDLSNADFIEMSDNTGFYYPVAIHLKAGDTITAVSPNSIAEVRGVNLSTIYASSSGSLSPAAYTAVEDVDVVVCRSLNTTTDLPYEYTVTHSSAQTYEDMLNAIKNKTVFTFAFATTAGDSNRESTAGIVQGECLITDLSCTAENRRRGVYTLQLTGTGELGIVTPAQSGGDNEDEDDGELG